MFGPGEREGVFVCVCESELMTWPKVLLAACRARSRGGPRSKLGGPE